MFNVSKALILLVFLTFEPALADDDEGDDGPFEDCNGLGKSLLRISPLLDEADDVVPVGLCVIIV